MALAMNRVFFRIITIAVSDISGSGGQGRMLVLSSRLGFGVHHSVSSAYVEDAPAQS